jgi:uncharacterized membrane protein
MSWARSVSVESLLGHGLVAGLLLALALLLLGLGLLVADGELTSGSFRDPPPADFTANIRGTVAGVLDLAPVALIRAGLLVLIATPLLRVVLAGLVFCRERDWVFALVALGILAVLLWGWRGL